MNRDRVHLVDMLSSARLLQAYVADVSREAFMKNMQLQDSVVRRIEIIGEAAGRVSQEFRDENSDIPWAAIRGMRNALIHRYDDIDMDIVWETVVQDIPRLTAQLEGLVPGEES